MKIIFVAEHIVCFLRTDVLKKIWDEWKNQTIMVGGARSRWLLLVREEIVRRHGQRNKT